MDDTTKRLLLAFALTMGVWFVFQRFFSPPPSPAPGKNASTPAGEAPRRETGQATTRAASAVGPLGAQPGDALGIEQTTTIRGDAWRAQLTTHGAALSSFALRDPRYLEARSGKMVPIDLVQVSTPPYPLEVDLGPSFSVEQPWTVEQDVTDQNSWRFVRSDERARVTKTFHFDRSSYTARLQIRAENLSTAAAQERLTIRVHGRQDPNAKTPGMFNPDPRHWSAVCHVNGKTKRAQRSDLAEEKSDLGELRWAGIDDKYFLLAVAPVDEKNPVRCTMRGGRDGRLETALEMASREVPVGAAVEREFLIYFGPKVLAELDAVHAAGRSIDLGDAVDYGWLAILCRPMIWLMRHFFAWFGNWGVAIILLTIVVKLATLYWTQKSMKSMRAMAKVAPEIKRVQEKFRRPEDRDRLNQEVMNLYKRHGVNPLGGCLPMLLQMPIWIALYKTLSQSVELYRSSFAFWIHDLAVPDRYFVLPGLLGLLSFGQTFLQAKSTPSTDPNQKMMMWMMPGMFIVFSLFVPAGLTLYWLVNTMLTMIHQWLMNRSDRMIAVRA